LPQGAVEALMLPQRSAIAMPAAAFIIFAAVTLI
jgi:hypothetical protein